MKKTNKPSNPLKVFNDNKAMAYKKAGGAMKDFKKSLPKAQDGKVAGPITRLQAAFNSASQPPIPYVDRISSYDNMAPMMAMNKAESKANMLNNINTAPRPRVNELQMLQQRLNNFDRLKNYPGGIEQMRKQKKGGSVKLQKAQTGKSVKPLTLKDKEGYQWNIDTTGYAKGVKNFYPYEKPYPGVKGVLTKAEMDKVMSNVGKALGTAKGPGSLAKAAANAAKSKKAKGGSVKSRKR